MIEKLITSSLSSIKRNFRYATLNFLFIIAYVNLFQSVFGMRNSIVGVIFVILMSASMVRDMTAEPVRNLLLQSFVMTGMAVSAFLVTTLPPFPAFIINLITIFLILYTFTYEYSNHMYFPYLLAYLFLLFISPVDKAALPVRLLGMLAGSVSVILYQLFMGRRRIVVTARDVLTEMIDETVRSISCILSGTGTLTDSASLRKKLCILSQLVYERRKKVFCVSDASFHMIDAGRGIEYLNHLVRGYKTPVSEEQRQQLEQVSDQLTLYRSFLQQKQTVIPEVCHEPYLGGNTDSRQKDPFHILAYIRDQLLHMADPDQRLSYHKTAQSLKVRLQTALDISPVRVIYALRVSLLLSCGTLLVQFLHLPHGKWFIFTLASVSLPYADDVPLKIKRRVSATVIGGLVSVCLYSAFTSGSGRTAIMMLSGYLSSYLTGYTATFSCSTIGALGGAVFTEFFSLKEVGNIFFIRMFYVCTGALIGYLVNCLFVPFKRATATEQLWRKYEKTVSLLSQICRKQDVDSQLYYHLIIQAHMMENKLSINAADSGWTDIPQLLSRCRQQLRNAHRLSIKGREHTLIFETYKG